MAGLRAMMAVADSLVECPEDDERRNDVKSGAGGRARSTYRLGEFGKSYCEWNPGVALLASVEGEPQIPSV